MAPAAAMAIIAAAERAEKAPSTTPAPTAVEGDCSWYKALCSAACAFPAAVAPSPAPAAVHIKASTLKKTHTAGLMQHAGQRARAAAPPAPAATSTAARSPTTYVTVDAMPSAAAAEYAEVSVAHTPGACACASHESMLYCTAESNANCVPGQRYE